MTGQDASFLYMETPSVHMHTLKITVVDLPDEIPFSDMFDMMRAVVESKLHLAPRFRLRPVEVPAGLHHPVWVKDPKFDLSRHLHRAHIPTPGGQREMDEAIADIASRQLHRDRPLWELWLLEGLADGGLVMVSKIHHSLADGVASAAMLLKMMDLEPVKEGLDAPPPPWPPEPMPSRLRLMADAFRDQREQVVRFGPLVKRTIAGGANVLKHMRERISFVPYPFRAPRTVFNRSLSPERSLATVSLPLEDMKAVKNAVGVTLNDVVLGIVSGALIRFFDDRGEHLTRPLIASVPIEVAMPGGVSRVSGNRIANLFTSLCNQVSNPLLRLKTIHEVTSESEQLQQRLGLETMLDWSEAAPAGPYRWVMRTYSKSGLSDYLPPPANLIVSNVRGPDRPLYIAGARLRKMYSVGPAIEGVCLNITASSYCGEVAFALIADADAIPDPHVITDAFPQALDELKQAAGLSSTSVVELDANVNAK
jgi:diacylglycerol O-acyltransferase